MTMNWSLVILNLISFQIGSVLSHFGIQSGPEPSASAFGGSAISWASGIAYDLLQNKIYLSGSTSGSFFEDSPDNSPQEDTFRCFVASLDLPLDESPADALQFTQHASYGTSNSSESCFGMVRTNEKLFLGGNSHSPNGGLLSPLKPPGGEVRPLLFGTILDVDLPNSDPIQSFTLQGGRLMRLGNIHYPVSVVTDASETGIYVATLLSDDKTENPNFNPNHPEPLSYPYGSNFRVYLERLTFGSASPDSDSLQETLARDWDLPIGNGNEMSVHVGGLIHAGSRLYLAGTTAGNSIVFPDPDSGRVDEDGFLVEIDASLGTLTGRKLRIQSQAGQDDRILGVCRDEGEDTEMFVVGATTGSFDTAGGEGQQRAFWAKISLDTFQVLWTKDIDAIAGPLSEGSDAALVGVACAVTPDGEGLYVAARALKGAVLNRQGHKSFGGTDVVLISASPEDGEIIYGRQIGTSADDIVTSVATDAEGNALVYGSTGGSLMRAKTSDEGMSSKMDVFLFSVSLENGDYTIPVEQQGEGTPPTSPPTASSGNSGGGPGDDINPPVGAPTTIDDVVPPPPLDNSENSNPSGGGKKGGLAAAVVLLFGAIAVAIFAAHRRARNNKKLYYPADSDHIVEYLKGFDDVEVDLKHSATGGWHGTYMNYPLDSRRAFPGDVTVDRMSNTVVQDTLFMDDYETPSLGGSGSTSPPDPFVIGGLDHGEEGNYDELEGLTASSSPSATGNYDGLVDAYNSTWQDRSTRGLGDGLDGPRQKVKRGSPAGASSSLLGSVDDVWGNEII